MKVKTSKIISFCEEYLKTKDFKDYCHNGLQVEGAPEVSRIVVGVSISEQLIREAIKVRAQMIIVHHGIFSMSLPNPPVIKNFMRTRLKLLLENDINLAGFHLPLDANPIIGNNISLCKLLGVKKAKPFDVGFIGELSKEMKLADFVKMTDEKLETNSFVISSRKGKVRKVAIISGGAANDFEAAKDSGADTFVCGSVDEHIVRAAEEIDINFINAGHYNTEKLGIINLGGLIAKKFGVKVEFIDVPNEI